MYNLHVIHFYIKIFCTQDFAALGLIIVPKYASGGHGGG